MQTQYCLHYLHYLYTVTISFKHYKYRSQKKKVFIYTEYQVINNKHFKQKTTYIKLM